MVDALIVSNLLLWGLVLVLAAVVAALVRQIGVLHERVAPAGALVLQGGLRAGERAPELELADWRGERLRIGGADAAAATLLLFVSPSCPLCKQLLPVADSLERAEAGRLRVVRASDGPREEHEDFVREHALASRRYVLSTELGLLYRVSKLPYAVLIDEAGVVRAAGLVNTREHLESLLEARERGVGSLQEYLAGPGRERRVA
jgi:methylamine dehydrogenase accessory protein MauD